MQCNLGIQAKNATWHGKALMQAYKHTYGNANGWQDGLIHGLGSSKKRPKTVAISAKEWGLNGMHAHMHIKDQHISTNQTTFKHTWKRESWTISMQHKHWNHMLGWCQTKQQIKLNMQQNSPSVQSTPMEHWTTPSKTKQGMQRGAKIRGLAC